MNFNFSQDGHYQKIQAQIFFISVFILSLKVLNLFAICVAASIQVKRETSLLRKKDVQICKSLSYYFK